MKLHEFKLAQLQVIQAECLEKIDISENHQIYLFLEDEQCYLEFENNIYPIELISTNSITASSAKELIKQRKQTLIDISKKFNSLFGIKVSIEDRSDSPRKKA